MLIRILHEPTMTQSGRAGCSMRVSHRSVQPVCWISPPEALESQELFSMSRKPNAIADWLQEPISAANSIRKCCGIKDWLTSSSSCCPPSCRTIPLSFSLIFSDLPLTLNIMSNMLSWRTRRCCAAQLNNSQPVMPKAEISDETSAREERLYGQGIVEITTNRDLCISAAASLTYEL